MNLTIAFVGMMLTAVTTCFAANPQSLTREAAQTNSFFDGRGSGAIGAALETLAFHKSPNSEISVPVADAFSDGSRFTSLEFSVNNTYTQTSTRLQLNANGGLLWLGPNKSRRCLTLSDAETTHLQELWSSAQLETGDKKIGAAVFDAETFKLTYGLCGKSFKVCGKGSISGPLVPSAWGANYTNLEPLVKYLKELQKRFDQKP